MGRGQNAKARRRARNQKDDAAADTVDFRAEDGTLLTVDESLPGQTDQDKKRMDSGVDVDDVKKSEEASKPAAATPQPSRPFGWKFRRYVRYMWPCRLYGWLNRAVPALYRGFGNLDLHERIYTFVLLVIFLWGTWVAMEGLQRIFQVVAAQEQCSIVYVTIPGPIITVSLIGATPSNPAQGTYYFSVVNGTTQWLNSVAPPTRVSSFITSTMQITYTPPPALSSALGTPYVPAVPPALPSSTMQPPPTAPITSASRGSSLPGFSYPSVSTPVPPSAVSPALPAPPPVTITTVLTQTSGLSTAVVTVTSVLSATVPAPSLPTAASSIPGVLPPVSSAGLPPLPSTVSVSSTSVATSLITSVPGFMTIQTSVPSVPIPGTSLSPSSQSAPASSQWASFGSWVTVTVSVPFTPSSGFMSWTVPTTIPSPSIPQMPPIIQTSYPSSFLPGPSTITVSMPSSMLSSLSSVNPIASSMVPPSSALAPPSLLLPSSSASSQSPLPSGILSGTISSIQVPVTSSAVPPTTPTPGLPPPAVTSSMNTTASIPASFNLTTITATLSNSSTVIRSCTDSTPVSGCTVFDGELSTRVISFANTEFSFAFPSADVTTTQSYWTGDFYSLTGTEPSPIPSTTRTVRQTPLSSLETLPSFVLARPTPVFNSSSASGVSSALQARQLGAIPSGFQTLVSPPVNVSIPSATTPGTPSDAPAPTQTQGCGEYGNFTLNFDDTTVDGDQSSLIPVHGMTNPYHHLFYANGYTYVPDKWEPYPSISQPNVAMFLPIGTSLLPNTPFAGTLLPGEFGSGPRASVSAYWFNAYFGYFGCALNGITPCDLRISGFRWDEVTNQEVVAIEKHVTIPPCWGFLKCKLQRVEFDEPAFRGLSGIQFNAYTSLLRIPQIFFADDLNLGWWNDTCEAGILRIGHR